MAEVVASTFLNFVFDKLASYFGSSLDVEDGLRKLRSTLSTIQDVIEDAEERPVKERALKGWLSELKDVTKDAADVLKFAAETGEWRPETEKVRSFFLKPNSFLFRCKLDRRIKEIMERLDEIAEKKSKFHLPERVVARDSMEYIGVLQEETSSCKNELEVYGRQEDTKKIVEFLINLSSGDDLGVLPIVGMRGLGKTTLAQLVYNDNTVCLHFKTRMWVGVSAEFDTKNIYRSITQYVGGKSVDNLRDMDFLERTLIEELGGKKYLLVLDDVSDQSCDVICEKWNRLKNLLCRYGAKGSKIIVTTRSERVASIMGTVPPHSLASLSDDDCWALFEKRAFGLGGANKTPTNLVDIGREIVKNCGGIPLVASALGSLLRCQKEESKWLAVKDSHQDWKIPNDENEILSVLMLIYNNLPSRLKQGFAYCSIFPKGYLIQKDELVRLWIAQGFIPSSSEENTDLKDMGFKYIEELLSRSLLQHFLDNYVTMHDLVHDLARYVAAEECSIVDASTPRGQKGLANSSTAHPSTSHDQSKDKTTSPTNKRDALANTLPRVTVNTGKRLKKTVELQPEPISLPHSNVDAIYQMVDDMVKAVDSHSSSSLSLEGPLKQDYLRFLDFLEVPFDDLVQRHSSDLIACIVSLSAAPVGFFTAQQQQLLSEMNQQLLAKISQALSYQGVIWAKTAFINSAKDLLDSSISRNREKDTKLRHEDAILANEEAELQDRLQRIKEARSKIKQERRILLSTTKEALAKSESDLRTLMAASDDIKEAQQNLKLMSIEWKAFKLSFTKF